MVFNLVVIITSLKLLCVKAAGGGTSVGNPNLYTYFETPLKDDVGAIGPSKWRDLDHIQNNQCGGNGQENGFGQSPVVLSQELVYWGICHAGMDGYEASPGTCNWDDLDFKITPHGLSIIPKVDKHVHDDDNHDEHEESTCNLGTINIPQSDKVYEATEIKIKLGAEHIIDGYANSFEMQIFHKEETSETQAVLAFLMELTPLDWTIGNPDYDQGQHPLIENLLDGWRAQFWETEDYCKGNSDGTGEYTIDSVLKSKQKLLLCPAPGKLEEIHLPRGNPQPTGLFPNVYDGFVESFGTFTYEGSLTSPPCTENVFWNLSDQFMYISFNQANELTAMTTCYIEKSTCEHASTASEFGRTSRPPQDLNGREIIHRCVEGANFYWEPESVPKIEKYKPEKAPKPYYAMLFPWFITALGVVIFFVLTRYIHKLPYTAVLFLIGTFMGMGVARTFSYDQLTKSTLMWENINGELLLVAFLPGLLFKDAYCLNVHLFYKSIGQTLIMAFPMVLGGTTLLALVAYYILPYGWTFNFCMTFGAILSATDPVAVSALLNELGAPPRLKMHISGESLLNDGSAIVFYAIFKALFLYEVGLGGQNISIGEGIGKFVEMSLGAAGLGSAFGLALSITLFVLNRRFNVEESIVQVCATIAVAYLTFYVAEVLLHQSGVIAVVFCGVTTKSTAHTLIIDQEMMNKFWNLVEHLLNSVLFALGGLVWGSVISNLDETRPEKFNGTDWAYLFLVYLLMTAIRFFLFGLFYPIISKIGLKSNKKEMVFHAFGGLRGAVGIALAVALDSEVIQNTVRTDPRRSYTSQLFGITGGISLLTLFINGVLAGPLLRKLGLNRASPDRKAMIKRYDQHLKDFLLDSMITNLAMKQYAKLDFELIKHFVPRLSDVSHSDVKQAIRRVKDSTPLYLYHEPHLELFKPIFSHEDFLSLQKIAKLTPQQRFQAALSVLTRKSMGEDTVHVEKTSPEEYESQLKEQRLVFIELLQSCYKEALENGLIDARDGFIDYLLERSVAMAEDEVSNKKPLNDWVHCANARIISNDISQQIYLAAAFIRSHTAAQEMFRFGFCQSNILNPSKAETQVLEESSNQIRAAESIFDSTNDELVTELMSVKISQILLNKAAYFIGSYEQKGFLKAEESEHFYEEFEHALKHVRKGVHKKDKGNEHQANKDVDSKDSFHINPSADINGEKAPSEFSA